jgi:DNA (cytosine-5)-methyltransferase 1
MKAGMGIVGTKRAMKGKYKALSLFAGCGGLDLGFQGGFHFRDFKFAKTQFEIVLANDFDADAERVYEANRQYFGKHQFHSGDVRDIRAEEIPEYDLLLAGFPCQPFSNAGNRKGIEDKDGRGTLFYECERFLRGAEKKSGRLPEMFVFENVRGIMSTRMPNGKTVPEEITRRMHRLGYNTVGKLIKVSNYGVPQNRYRYIMVGTKKGRSTFDFAELDRVASEYGLPNADVDPYELTLGSILADIPNGASLKDAYWTYAPSGQKMIDAIGPCVDGRSALKKFAKKVPLERISNTIQTGRSWKNIPPDDLPPRFRRIHDDPKRYHAPNFYRRFALGEVCGTITASAQPENCGITHPFENRRFSVREIARVQSFPDDFDFPYTTIAGAYKVIGNAVPPVFAWVLARAVQNHLGAIND